MLYRRAPRLFAELATARGEGRLPRMLAMLERTRLLIIDDWGPEPLTAEQRRDLLEIVDDRYEKGSLLVTSQIPVKRWHELDRRSDDRRRDPRPRRPPRPSHRTEGTQPAQAPRRQHADRHGSLGRGDRFRCLNRPAFRRLLRVQLLRSDGGPVKPGLRPPPPAASGLTGPPPDQRLGHDHESVHVQKAVQPERTPEDNSATMA